jgi:nucleoside-diphosphate-sugar epimerase
MQNILAHWEKITEEGIYPVPYSVETRLSLVDLRDVTQVIARVLTEPGHTGATYELVGTKAFSQLEVAEILSEKLGRLVSAHTVPLDVWERQARAADLGDYQVETLIKMFKYYEHYGFWGNIHVLSWLLDRPPTSLETFIEHISQERFLQSNRSKEAKPK